MSRRLLTFQNVTFAYDQMSDPVLFQGSFAFPAGWTGIVGVNGAGKTTVLKLATGLLLPDSGWVRRPGRAIYCEQRTDQVPVGFRRFLESTDGSAVMLKASLNVGEDWEAKWNVLSHGERKRAQIAAALWEAPDVLALDEPTNHIDRKARLQLSEAVEKYRGIGLLVSHDRSLLDGLCRQCLFVEPDRSVLRPGSYSAGRAESDREESSKRQRHDALKEECFRLERSLARARSRAVRSSRKGSKRHLSARDHDARARIDLARISGRDAAVSRRCVQFENRLERESERRDSLSVKKHHTLGVWTEGERSRRDSLFRIPGGRVSLGAGRHLVYPDLTMFPTDRIALTGPNGSGKTTLLRLILGKLKDAPERVVYLPQEIDALSSSETLGRIRRSCRAELGRVMTLVRRLGSDPDRLMQTAQPSPGEMRKALLAIGLAASPHLIVLDEPTNHLDLPSIESMESALSDCACGLLLVSHDEQFLNALAVSRWHTEPAPAGPDWILRLNKARGGEELRCH